MKQINPRIAVFYGMKSEPLLYGLGTWLEPEEITYPSGKMIRRARAINAETGRLNLVWCGIPDTFFSIPVKGGGYLTMNGSSLNPILIYHPKSKSSKSSKS